MFLNCPGGAGSAGLIDNYGHTATSLAGSYNVYPTNVAGIGFAITYSPSFAFGIQGYPNNSDGTNPNNAGNTATATLKFIKTSTAYFSGMSAQTNMNGDLATWYAGTNKVRFNYFTISNTTIFTKPDSGGGGGGGGGTTCTITSFPVPLGTAKLADMNTNGRSQSVSFNVRLGPCSAKPTNITYRLTPQSGYIGNTSDGKMPSSLAGVGIEVKDGDGNLVNWLTDSQLPSNAAQLGRGAIIPFTAAMFKSGTISASGTVGGQIVFSINYQ